jgi:hypothetical protein
LVVFGEVFYDLGSSQYAERPESWRVLFNFRWWSVRV